jgi:hypothetical protein
VWGLTRAVVPGPQLGNLVNRKVQIESSQRGLPDSKRKESGLIRISFRRGMVAATKRKDSGSDNPEIVVGGHSRRKGLEID